MMRVTRMKGLHCLLKIVKIVREFVGLAFSTSGEQCPMMMRAYQLCFAVHFVDRRSEHRIFQ
jgi:hypothetical protein